MKKNDQIRALIDAYTELAECSGCSERSTMLALFDIFDSDELVEGCYDRGYDFGGLYRIYHRCSCWCCPFQRIDELRKLRLHHPELWQKLLALDQRAYQQFGDSPLG